MVVCSKWSVLLALLVLSSVVASAAGGFVSEGNITLGPTGNGASLARLRQDDIVRADPLDKLRKYRGGYDITNKHYWSSVVFTGLHGHAVALLWLFCGVLLGGFLAASSCIQNHNENDKAKKKHMHLFKKCDIVLLILAAAFTALPIIAGGVVLDVNAQFYSRARQVVSIIKETADNAYVTLNKTTGALKSISKAMETSTILIADPYLLESTSAELDSAAASILIQAKKNRRQVNNGFKILFITSTVKIALSLVPVMGLSVSGFLSFKKILRRESFKPRKQKA